jgi:hypothetical protein
MNKSFALGQASVAAHAFEWTASRMSNDQVSFIDGVGEVHGNRFDTKTAVLSNGATITKLNEAGPVALFNFSYEDERFRFRFIASRWGDDRRPRDTWIAFIGYGLSSMPDVAKRALNDAALAHVEANIKQALLAWPPGKPEASVPLRDVEFRLKGWNSGTDLRTGE